MVGYAEHRPHRRGGVRLRRGSALPPVQPPVPPGLFRRGHGESQAEGLLAAGGGLPQRPLLGHCGVHAGRRHPLGIGRAHV